MNIDLYQVDAFTDRPFHGNPAAICPLESWLSDELMQAIAAENNLSETAFLVSAGNRYQLRWFTPVSEVDLCGHATLAAAFVVFLQNDTVRRVEFDTRSGLLAVEKDGAWFRMDFPAWTAAPFAAPALLFDALRVEAKEIYKARDVLVVLNSESEIKAVQPDFALLEQIDALGVVVSARGTDADFVSRFFAPREGIPEDPVTGSSHSMLVPFWAKRLHKTELLAKQLSKRGGVLRCRHCGDRVEIAGQAVLFSRGLICL